MHRGPASFRLRRDCPRPGHGMQARYAAVSLLVVLIAGPAAEVRAWHSQGHVWATDMAIQWGRDRLPAFLGQGIGTVAHCSVDPDVFKFVTDSNALYRTEYPDHFFDLEYFTSASLPKDRPAFVSWCLSHKQWFSGVGTLPYAVTEWTYRLATALAEYRRWPDDPAIGAKCQVYAGILAHYAEDLCMPLHATVHYDGRASASGDSPHTGIHAKVDALIGKVIWPAEAVMDPNRPAPFEDCLIACLAEIRASNSLVDRVYALEQDLPEPNDPVRQGSGVEAFAQERLQATALFTARVLVTAWEKSKTVEIPDWHQRTPPTRETVGWSDLVPVRRAADSGQDPRLRWPRPVWSLFARFGRDLIVQYRNGQTIAQEDCPGGVLKEADPACGHRGACFASSRQGL